MKPGAPPGAPGLPHPGRVAAQGVNALGAALLARLCDGGQRAPHANAFLSPASIASAMALALAGAPPASETAREIRAAIAPRLAPDDDAVTALGALSSAALGGGGGGRQADACTVACANSVWVRAPLAFSRAYLARAASLAASTHALTTAAAINAWCADATAGRIADAVDDGAIAPAVAVLVNALYFSGKWAAPFQPGLSRGGRFYAAAPAPPRGAGGEGEGDGADGADGADDPRPVLMESAHFMARPGDKAARLLTAPGACTALRLAYAGGDAGGEGDGGGYEAVVVLPCAGASVAVALAAVDAAYAADEEGAGDGDGDGDGAAPDTPRWVRPLAGVDVRLPAFTIDAGVALGPLLRAEGVRAAFGEGPAGADFSDMLVGSGGGGGQPAVGPSISEVVHRVWISTDEAGTEAAAVTAVVMVRAMLARAAVFNADHPFLFGVRHVATGAWLFLGRVGVPKAWSGGGVAAVSSAVAAGGPGCGGGGGAVV